MARVRVELDHVVRELDYDRRRLSSLPSGDERRRTSWQMKQNASLSDFFSTVGESSDEGLKKLDRQERRLSTISSSNSLFRFAILGSRNAPPSLNQGNSSFR
jgi:hypothetical protein